LPFTGQYGKILFHAEKFISGGTIVVIEVIASSKDFQGAEPVFGLLLLRDEENLDFQLEVSESCFWLTTSKQQLLNSLFGVHGRSCACSRHEETGVQGGVGGLSDSWGNSGCGWVG